jgi:hypothetical protein
MLAARERDSKKQKHRTEVTNQLLHVFPPYGMTTKKRDTSVLSCHPSHPRADWQQELKGKQREHTRRFTPFSWGNVFALFSHDMITP